jgi:hypothetical protein
MLPLIIIYLFQANPILGNTAGVPVNLVAGGV